MQGIKVEFGREKRTETTMLKLISIFEDSSSAVVLGKLVFFEKTNFIKKLPVANTAI